MYRFIIDRSDLDEIVAIVPVGHKDNPGPVARKVTRREDLEGPIWPRRDIVLFSGTRSGKQHTLEVTPTGYAGDLWILDVLSDEEHDQVEGIAERMRQNAEVFEPAGKLIYYGK